MGTVGSAVVMNGAVPHGVTRMTSGTRHALVLFFGRPCPNKFAGAGGAETPHTLLLCAPRTLQLMYTHADGGCYHCDGCARVCTGRAMWHCQQGCEYDLCVRCHT